MRENLNFCIPVPVPVENSFGQWPALQNIYNIVLYQSIFYVSVCLLAASAVLTVVMGHVARTVDGIEKRLLGKLL